MVEALRVGIIGANARGGWAGDGHVPAIKGLRGLTLAAVATNRQQTADEAAHAFGAPKAYSSGASLIADSDIDIVTVATRVPDHCGLVLEALAAGKHVYCEWPLGQGSAESDELMRAASRAGTHHAIGLQLRGSPAVRAARECLEAGAIGRLLSISAFSSTAGFGPNVATRFAYLEDPGAFANLVTIQGAHTLDLILALGGTPTDLSALTSRQFPQIEVGDNSERRQRQTFDHLLVQGRLDGGAPFAVEVAGGRTKHTPFFLVLEGDKGTLRLEGGAPRGLQAGRIALVRDDKRVTVPEGELEAMPDAAANVAGVYAALRDDIVNGTTTVLGFDHAARLTHILDAVFQSSVELRSISAAEWAA